MDNTNIVQENQEYVDSKCPNCGSKLQFLPGSNNVKCISCDSTFEIESLGQGKLEDEEVDYSSTLEKIRANSLEMKKQRTIHCESCGGLILLNDKTVSTTCPFCNSNRVVLEDKQQEIIKIAGVVPFVIDEESIKDTFRKWIRKRFLAPSKFKKGKVKPSFSAFYIPYYTFDSDTNSNYTAYRGDYYYVTRTVRTSNGYRTVRERRTRWTFVRGQVFLQFDDILVNGTNNILNKYISKISNFDFSLMERYQEKFLLGYYAERPSVTLEDGFNSAKNVMMQNIRQRCVRDIGGDTYRDLRVSTNFNDVTFKQIMVPIYNGSYEYNKKKYQFVCNGQNGKFAGKHPVSPIKVILFVLAIIIVAALTLLLTYYFFQNS